MAPPAPDPSKVSFVESFTQPEASPASFPDSLDPTDSQLDDETSGGGIRKRPSIIVGGDSESLAAVRTVHSPRSNCTSPKGFSSASSASSPPTKVKGAWRRKVLHSGWTGPAELVLSVVGLVISMRCYDSFLRWNETRTDIPSHAPLADPVLPHLTAVDCSAVLSVLVYGGILMAFKYSCTKPDVFLEYGQTHAAVMWVRMLVLYLTPLEAPPGTVPLVDPIAHPDGTVLVRDLFFSGHTATTFGLFITVRRQDRKWRVFFALLTLLTASLVLVQKAHYTIDVVAAPCFVHTTHTLVMAVRQWAGNAFASKKTDKQFRSGVAKMKAF